MLGVEVPANPIKRRLADGEVVLGSMVMEFESPGMARIAAQAGADFLLLDLEHTRFGLDSIATLSAVAVGAGVAPLVRVPELDQHLIGRVLDLGAHGIMVPDVVSESQARALVAAAKYPPDGRRGVVFGVAHDDYAMPDPATMATANNQVLTIAQIESPDGAEAAADIAAVNGLDVVWVGHGDLAVSLGAPQDFEHPDFTGAVARVEQALRTTGKVGGWRVSDAEEARNLASRGFRCLAYLNDILLYRNGLKAGLQDIRAGT